MKPLINNSWLRPYAHHSATTIQHQDPLLKYYFMMRKQTTNHVFWWLPFHDNESYRFLEMIYQQIVEETI